MLFQFHHLSHYWRMMQTSLQSMSRETRHPITPIAAPSIFSASPSKPISTFFPCVSSLSLFLFAIKMPPSSSTSISPQPSSPPSPSSSSSSPSNPQISMALPNNVPATPPPPESPPSTLTASCKLATAS